MTLPKYELIRNPTKPEETGPFTGYFRIRALRDFVGVKAGTIGGFVESEDTLSHDGNCWIADNALVDGYARIKDDALVSQNAIVGGNVVVSGQAKIAGWAQVRGCYQRPSIQLSGFAYIYADPPYGGPGEMPRRAKAVSDPKP